MAVHLIFEKDDAGEREKGIMKSIGLTNPIGLRAKFADDPGAPPLLIFQCNIKRQARECVSLSIRVDDPVGPRKITEDEIGEIMDHLEYDRIKFQVFHDSKMTCHVVEV